jgi:hypothetical protein
MFIIYRCYDFGNGKLNYNSSSIIGIFDNFQLALRELLSKLNELKYSFEIEDIYNDNDNYFFIKIDSKNGKEIFNGLCYEIIEKKKFIMNEIKLK